MGELALSRTDFEKRLAVMDRVIVLAAEPCGGVPEEPLDSDLDAIDLCFAITVGLLGTVLTTSENIEAWFADVHDAASGKRGEYSFVQGMLGDAFYHKGDWLDVYADSGGFVARDGEKAYVMFHRLLFGHDVLAKGEGLMPYNPFKIMFEQKGMWGILQAMRHLIADTMSKQGLPLPGSSWFDYTNDKGRPWNRMIDWVYQLSTEVCGNKAMSQEIYSHLLTVRMQDILSGGLCIVLPKAYEAARGIDDPVRKAQLELLAVSVAFFGQAAVGSIRQKGVPYINNAMAPQMAGAFAALLVASNKRTATLHLKTGRILRESSDEVRRFESLHEEKSLIMAENDDLRVVGASVSDMIDFLEGGQNGYSR